MRTVAIIAAAAVLLDTRVADAEPPQVSIASAVPKRCRAFAVIPIGETESVLGWNQLLSLAACLQTGARTRITTTGELTVKLRELAEPLAPSVRIYMEAVAHAPPDAQIRAAYHLANTLVALMTRARASVAEPEVATLTRGPALRDQLKRRLASTGTSARQVFAVIDQMALDDPGLRSDPVLRSMIDSARAQLGCLPAPRESATTVRALR